MSRTATAWGRGLVGLALALVLLVALARPAAAHTALASSNPADGATVAELEHLELRFTEPIEPEASHVYVEDVVGFLELPRARAGADGRSLVVDVPPLGDGTYDVTWHVVARDGDAVEGRLRFHVAGPADSATAVTLGDPAADFPPDTSLAVPLDDFDVVADPGVGGHGHGPGALAEQLARVLTDTAVAVWIGGVAFVVLAWPGGARVFAARRVLWAAALLAAVASYEGVAFQYASFRGLGTLAGLAPWHQWDALEFRFGRIAAVRALLLVGALVLTARLGRDRGAAVRDRRWQVVAAGVSLGLLQTLVVQAHAQSSGPLSSAARLLHVAGVAVWLGAVVLVLAAVLPRRRPKELATVLPRCSTMATGAVAALVAGGVVLSVELVGTPSALVTTGYGRVLLAKVALVAGALVVATRARRLVRHRLPERSRLDPVLVPAGGGRTRRARGAALAVAEAETTAVQVGRAVAAWMAVEIGFLVAVLAASSLLLTRVPPS